MGTVIVMGIVIFVLLCVIMRLWNVKSNQKQEIEYLDGVVKDKMFLIESRNNKISDLSNEIEFLKATLRGWEAGIKQKPSMMGAPHGTKLSEVQPFKRTNEVTSINTHDPSLLMMNQAVLSQVVMDSTTVHSHVDNCTNHNHDSGSSSGSSGGGCD